MAEAQKRTELRVEELAAAQKRTELRVEELAAVQTRTKIAVAQLARRLDDTYRQLGGLAMTVGYTLENESYRYLPALLEQDYAVQLEGPLYRDYLTDRKGRDAEVNIFGYGHIADQPIVIIGESKAQLSTADIDRFLKQRIGSIDTGSRKPFSFLVAYMTDQQRTREYAKEKGVAVYLSYQFGQQ